MRKLLTVTILSFIINIVSAQNEKLFYHEIKTDNNGNILPWYSDDLGKSYNHVINLVWNFWDTMRRDMNGLPYYMNHQVWNPTVNDHRGIGGDQLAMALSSWRLLYAYTGDEHIKENMRFMADYYVTHGLSPATAKWANIPFPYNTLIYSGIFDGDMKAGKDITQPDKAGSLGSELVHLYKIENDTTYLGYAVRIANTLSAHIKNGDSGYSPLPFKVNVYTGKIALLANRDFKNNVFDTACYTSNWAPTMQLFLDLIQLKQGDTVAYQKSFNTLLQWMKKYPMQLNKWGPFFEDVDVWSQTQINAMTFARFIMEHQQYFPQWQSDVYKIINWVHSTFNNNSWKKYGVAVTNEQTVYPVPGESHTARQGADELLFESLTGDTSLYKNAVRLLSWATYTVDNDGKNVFPNDENWLTDGYGDYVRHYLRAMDAFPQLAPDEDHIISSTSVIQQADYKGNIQKYNVPLFNIADTNNVRLFYITFDIKGIERIRLQSKPSQVYLENKAMMETPSGEGYEWQQLKEGGLLIVRRLNGRSVVIVK